MIKEFTPKFTLTIHDVNKIKLYHALESITPLTLAARLREEAIDNAYVPDDDEPMSIESRVDIKNMEELTKVLQAFSGHRIRTALWAQGGSEKTDGFKVGLEDTEKYCFASWYCDTDAILKQAKEVIEKSVRALGGLL